MIVENLSHRKLKLYKSFSLFELLIYIAILSVVMIFVSQIIFPVKKIEKKTQAIIELERNANSILNVFSYNIRLASSINSISGSDLSLVMADSNINPTNFSLSQGRIYIQQGGGDLVTLNSDKVYIDSLSFEEITNQSPAKKSIKISFSLHYVGPGATNQGASKTIETTFNLR